MFSKSSLIIAAICVGILGAIGFAIGTFKIPDSNNFGITRKAGGEKIDDIIVRFIKFRLKKNRIYVFTKEEGK